MTLQFDNCSFKVVVQLHWFGNDQQHSLLRELSSVVDSVRSVMTATGPFGGRCMPPIGQGVYPSWIERSEMPQFSFQW